MTPESVRSTGALPPFTIVIYVILDDTGIRPLDGRVTTLLSLVDWTESGGRVTTLLSLVDRMDSGRMTNAE